MAINRSNRVDIDTADGRSLKAAELLRTSPSRKGLTFVVSNGEGLETLTADQIKKMRASK